MLDLLSDPQIWIAFFALTALELVLGNDNIIRRTPRTERGRLH
jgi:predicted tellurium resistance membrane protein TerC